MVPEYQIPMLPLMPKELGLIEEGQKMSTKKLSHIHSMSGFSTNELEQHILSPASPQPQTVMGPLSRAGSVDSQHHLLDNKQMLIQASRN